MNINELRINNRVLNDNDFEMFVVGIYHDEVFLDFEGNEADYFVYKSSEIKPIVLTEQMLLDFGFVYNMKNNFYSKYDEELGNDILVIRYGGIFYELGKSKYKQIKFLHQLQNLFFSLKEIELSKV